MRDDTANTRRRPPKRVIRVLCTAILFAAQPAAAGSDGDGDGDGIRGAYLDRSGPIAEEVLSDPPAQAVSVQAEHPHEKAPRFARIEHFVCGERARERVRGGVLLHLGDAFRVTRIVGTHTVNDVHCDLGIHQAGLANRPDAEGICQAPAEVQVREPVGLAQNQTE